MTAKQIERQIDKLTKEFFKRQTTEKRKDAILKERMQLVLTLRKLK